MSHDIFSTILVPFPLKPGVSFYLYRGESVALGHKFPILCRIFFQRGRRYQVSQHLLFLGLTCPAQPILLRLRTPLQLDLAPTDYIVSQQILAIHPQQDAHLLNPHAASMILQLPGSLKLGTEAIHYQGHPNSSLQSQGQAAILTRDQLSPHLKRAAKVNHSQLGKQSCPRSLSRPQGMKWESLVFLSVEILIDCVFNARAVSDKSTVKTISISSADEAKWAPVQEEARLLVLECVALSKKYVTIAH